jgi:hypothetical protein
MFKVKCIKSYIGPSWSFTKGKEYNARNSQNYTENGCLEIEADNGKILSVHPKSLLGIEYLMIRNCDTCIERKCNSCPINKETKC